MFLDVINQEIAEREMNDEEEVEKDSVRCSDVRLQLKTNSLYANTQNGRQLSLHSSLRFDVQK